MGQLTSSRITPGSVFSNVGIDYAGPVITKSGHTRRPILQKTYICVFVCMVVKAVHLEAVCGLDNNGQWERLLLYILDKMAKCELLQ